MQIVCPNCSARYLTPDDQIGPKGRRVRCARCSEVWRVPPPEPPSDSPAVETPAAEAAAPEMAAAAAPAREAESAHQERPIRIDPLPRSRTPTPTGQQPRGKRGWVVFLGTIVLILAVLFLARNSIMSVWPAATRLYEPLGLASTGAPRPSELRLTDKLQSDWDTNANGEVLVLSGEVENPTERELPAPLLRVELMDGNGTPRLAKRELVPGGPLKPGETRPVTMRFENPGNVQGLTSRLEPVR